ncbi:MAG: hypothetical protein WCO33_01315 [bacterium]
MKNTQTIFSGIFFIILIACVIGVTLWYLNWTNSLLKSSVTEKQAIDSIVVSYPELKDFPSNGLPPRSIKSVKSGNNLYVAFIQEGSGRPILSAKCFLVDYNKNILSENAYNPSMAEDSTSEFSPITCTPTSKPIK